jgi:hypothetical protein
MGHVLCATQHTSLPHSCEGGVRADEAAAHHSYAHTLVCMVFEYRPQNSEAHGVFVSFTEILKIIFT